VRLSLTEYEQVRLDSRHFAVVPGHDFPATERVVSGNDRFEVVEKVGPPIDVTDRTDRRVPGPAGRREAPD
jgi:hypothetical protein